MSRIDDMLHYLEEDMSNCYPSVINRVTWITLLKDYGQDSSLHNNGDRLCSNYVIQKAGEEVVSSYSASLKCS